MKTKRLLQGAAALTMLLPLYACSVPTKDELECNLPNGDKFILINKFNYDPVSLICLHACTSRYDQTGFKVFYKPQGQWKSQETGISGPDKISLKKAENRNELCANFGIFGTALTAHNTLKLADQSDFDKQQRIGPRGKQQNPTSLWQPKPPGYKAQIIEQAIREKNIYPYALNATMEFLSEVASQLVYEVPLTPGNNALGVSSPLVSVIQSTSIDGGKTWSEPIITTDSKLFEIGKPLIDQKGIAKPSKYSIGPGAD